MNLIPGKIFVVGNNFTLWAKFAVLSKIRQQSGLCNSFLFSPPGFGVYC